MKLKPIELAAFHEAGHAVVYHILGRKLIYINAKVNGEGMCLPLSDRPIYFERGHSKLLTTEMIELGLISFAGFVAEAKTQWGFIKPEVAFKLGEPVDGIFPYSDYGNFRSKLEFANNLSESNYFGYSFFEEMLAMTVKLFTARPVWMAAINLATALLESKEFSLSGDEIHSLLENEIDYGVGVERFLNPELAA